MTPLNMVAFGATIADIEDEFIKIGGVWDDIKGWMQQHPELTGGIGGGLMGLLAAKGMSQQGDPYAGQKSMLGLLLGAGGGAALGHYLPDWFGWGSKKPVPTTKSPSAAAESSGPTGIDERPTLDPIQAINNPGPERGGASISAAQVEPRTVSTAQGARQQAAQRAAEQTQRASANAEMGELGKDQGRVVARIQALMSPRPGVPSSSGRNVVIRPAPGVQQIYPNRNQTSYFGGSKTPYLEGKTASSEKKALDMGSLQAALDEVKGFVQRNPWAASSAGGAALGGGLGWSSKDPETRNRKILMGLITGGLLGGAGGYLGEKAVRSMPDISDASRALRDAGRSVGSLGDEAKGAIQQASQVI